MNATHGSVNRTCHAFKTTEVVGQRPRAALRLHPAAVRSPVFANDLRRLKIGRYPSTSRAAFSRHATSMDTCGSSIRHRCLFPQMYCSSTRSACADAPSATVCPSITSSQSTASTKFPSRWPVSARFHGVRHERNPWFSEQNLSRVQNYGGGGSEATCGAQTAPCGRAQSRLRQRLEALEDRGGGPPATRPVSVACSQAPTPHPGAVAQSRRTACA